MNFKQRFIYYATLTCSSLLWLHNPQMQPPKYQFSWKQLIGISKKNLPHIRNQIEEIIEPLWENQVNGLLFFWYSPLKI